MTVRHTSAGNGIQRGPNRADGLLNDSRGGPSPLVSIGMPVFNGEAYIADAISSILSQTFKDFELIISDNGSTDATTEICRSFAATDRRVSFIVQTRNRGAAWNFNHVFSVSRGRYFKWAAYDDLIEPGFLESCVEILNSDRGCVLAYPRTTFIDESGNQTLCYLEFMASDSVDPVRRFDRWMAPGIARCNPVYGLIRREVIEKTSLHGDYMGSDHVLLGEIAILGRVRMAPEPMFRRRLHAFTAAVANADSLSLSEWYSGKRVCGLRFKTLRLIREFARAINRAELSRTHRLGCYVVLLRWIHRMRFGVIKELTIPLYVNGRSTALNFWLRKAFGLGAKPARLTEPTPTSKFDFDDDVRAAHDA